MAEKVEVQIRADTTASTQNDKQIQQFDQLFDLDIITSKHPTKLGNCKAYWYDKKGNPFITIGPDCKHIIRDVLCLTLIHHKHLIPFICLHHRL